MLKSCMDKLFKKVSTFAKPYAIHPENFPGPAKYFNQSGKTREIPNS